MENRTRKKKRKSRYSVVFIPHSPEKSMKQFFLSSWYARTVIFFAVVLLIGLSAYGIAEGIVNGSLLQGNNNKVKDLTLQVDELTKTNDELVMENTELQDKNDILVATVNQKLAEEEVLAAKYIPTGFPILGTTSIIEEPATVDMTTVTESYVPMVIFEAGNNVSIIATGNGTVTEIAVDANYGYVVVIDHGNGYGSVYRFKSEPNVKIGDEITRGTMIGKTTADAEKIGYQITLDGTYINPMDIMEIYG